MTLLYITTIIIDILGVYFIYNYIKWFKLEKRIGNLSYMILPGMVGILIIISMILTTYITFIG